MRYKRQRYERQKATIVVAKILVQFHVSPVPEADFGQFN